MVSTLKLEILIFFPLKKCFTVNLSYFGNSKNNKVFSVEKLNKIKMTLLLHKKGRHGVIAVELGC